MVYDFNKEIPREQSGSVKWDLRESRGDKDIIPMWVADMDFQAPDEIINALTKRAGHGIFGYTYPSDSYREAVCLWMKKRHNWGIEKEWIVTTPGVISAFSAAIETFTDEEDKIIIQPPVYHPFKKVIKASNRRVIENRLIIKDGHYTMDFAGLEQLLKDGASMMVLCSPHNPVGRVWTMDELKTLNELCMKYDTFILSDEIHSDLIMPGYKHRVMAKISSGVNTKIITCTAASKSFNLAGLSCSNVIISDPHIRGLFLKRIQRSSISTPNIFGLLATETAYSLCEGWLDELLLYIHENYLFMRRYIEDNLPLIKVTDLEGTYLSWLDFSGYGLTDAEIDETLIKQAKVWFDNGPQFGAGGEGFQRINLACTRNTLIKALERIKAVFSSI
ncbi:MAG: pyridoxal phosphate-dependent aminotransferase [Desulfatiglans sp.]|jgi:cystathionine beta-lyase|nr:pyridoxal phosphate-dependent aminotransferase [Desulfatiglans sp.]